MNETYNHKLTGWKYVIYRVRRLKPEIWLLIFVIMLAVLETSAPFPLWAIFWSDLMTHKVLVSMLAVLCLLAVSLVWAAGQRIDAVVFSLFNIKGGSRPWLDRIMTIITELGNGIVTIGIAVIFFFAINHLLAYKFIFGTLSLWITVEAIKVLVKRPRPFSKLTNVRVVGSRARGHSFPSGHTSQAFFIATLLARYFNPALIVVIILYFIALLVGITRMYMGMHYPRDVLAGAVLGTVWAFIETCISGYLLG